MGISNLSFSATNINVGLDADKSATPRAGDMYLATDTEFLYKCYVDDSWVSDELTEAKIDAVKPDILDVSSGSYSGNNSVNRAIPHGLGAIPRFIFLRIADNDNIASIRFATAEIDEHHGTGVSLHDVTLPDDTNFYVGNAANYVTSMNGNTYTMHWVAYS